jgi:hypothetical protein
MKYLYFLSLVSCFAIIDNLWGKIKPEQYPILGKYISTKELESPAKQKPALHKVLRQIKKSYGNSKHSESDVKHLNKLLEEYKKLEKEINKDQKK